MLYRALGFPVEGFHYHKFRTAEERPVGPIPWEEEKEPDALAPVLLKKKVKKKEKKSSVLAPASSKGKEKTQSTPTLCEKEEKEDRPVTQAIYIKRENSCSGSQLDLIWEEEEHWDEADRIGRAYTCDVASMA